MQQVELGLGGSTEGRGRCSGEAEEEGGKWGALCKDTGPDALYGPVPRVTDLWAQAILSNPATVARAVRGEKGGAGIEAPLPNPL